MSKWIWLMIGIPVTVCLYIVGIIGQLIWATALLFLAKGLGRPHLEKYAWNLLVSIDQLGNAVFGGDPDETISSRAGKMRDKALWAKVLCWFLNTLEAKHVENAEETDEGKNKVID